MLGVEVYDENIGLVSKVALMLGRERYSVRPIGRPEESGLRTFGKPVDAIRDAEEQARRYDATFVIEMIVRGRAVALVGTTGPDDNDDAGGGGVREPRRTRPGSSAGAVELELPE